MSDCQTCRGNEVLDDGSPCWDCAREVCEHVGHDWADAGGGLEMCMACMAERWPDDSPSRGRA